MRQDSKRRQNRSYKATGLDNSPLAPPSPFSALLCVPEHRVDDLYGCPLWSTSMGFLTLAPPESDGGSTAEEGVLTGASLLGRCGRDWI